LGIVVDLAHASHETVLAALRVATQPFIVSHTSLNSRTGGDPRVVKMMQPRLISKEHAKVVADAGSVVGVWTHLTDSLPDFVGSIKSMVDAIGIDYVGIGSDTDLLSSRVGSGTNRAWPGLTGGFFPAVVGEMLRQASPPTRSPRLAEETTAGSSTRSRLTTSKRHRSHSHCCAIASMKARNASVELNAYSVQSHCD